jgi:hypothetical protein
MMIPLPQRKDLSRGQKRRWYARLLTASWRRLPDWVVIGATRCGSTSLFSYLTEHPDVLPSLRKEVHFYDLNWHFGERWYRAHFPFRRALKQNGGGSRVVTGEATPNYLFIQGTPARLKTVTPDAKLIVVLRNPVDRAISAYHFMVERGRETLPIERALDPAAEWVDGRGMDPPYEPGEPSRPGGPSYLARGQYADQLEHWLQHFPREQLLILNTADFLRRTPEVMERVFDFVGVRPWSAGAFPQRHKLGYEKPGSAVRAPLVDYFREPNRRLYELLGRELDWDR